MVSNVRGETFLFMQCVKCCTLLKWILDLPFFEAQQCNTQDVLSQKRKK